MVGEHTSIPVVSVNFIVIILIPSPPLPSFEQIFLSEMMWKEEIRDAVNRKYAKFVYPSRESSCVP